MDLLLVEIEESPLGPADTAPRGTTPSEGGLRCRRQTADGRRKNHCELGQRKVQLVLDGGVAFPHRRQGLQQGLN